MVRPRGLLKVRCHLGHQLARSQPHRCRQAISAGIPFKIPGGRDRIGQTAEVDIGLVDAHFLQRPKWPSKAITPAAFADARQLAATTLGRG